RRTAAVRVRALRRGGARRTAAEVRRQPDPLLHAAGGGLGAGQPAAGDEVRDGQCAGPDREADAGPEPGPPGPNYPGNQRDRRWRQRAGGCERREGVREMTATVTEKNDHSGAAGAVGRVARVIGPVVDVEFPADEMPDMYNALEVDITLGDITQTITLEVALH